MSVEGYLSYQHHWRREADAVPLQPWLHHQGGNWDDEQVRRYRQPLHQNVYENLEVDNIAKAVAHAVHYGII